MLLLVRTQNSELQRSTLIPHEERGRKQSMRTSCWPLGFVDALCDVGGQGKGDRRIPQRLLLGILSSTAASRSLFDAALALIMFHVPSMVPKRQLATQPNTTFSRKCHWEVRVR